MKEHAEITVRDIANRTSSHMVIKDNGNGSTLWSGYQYKVLESIYSDAVCENVTVQSNLLILWLHHDEVERVTHKAATA